MGMVFEKLTLWTCTEDYGRPTGITALDYVMKALESIEPECKVLSYDTEDYTLVKPDAMPTRRAVYGHREYKEGDVLREEE
jgi:hypothetical protein